jgi:hypothetical protein
MKRTKLTSFPKSEQRGLTITFNGSVSGPLIRSVSADLEPARSYVILEPAAYFVEVPVFPPIIQLSF